MRKQLLRTEIRLQGDDVLHSKGMHSERQYIQHGDVSVYEHCLHVAFFSLLFAEWLHLSVDRRSLIRGALLHDYFLYDWHDKTRENYQKLHGFYHPGIALKNADREYHLTLREKDIIKKHMWPLTLFPPLCREAWIVTTADKYCSLLETLRLRRGNAANIRRKVRITG